MACAAMLRRGAMAIVWAISTEYLESGYDRYRHCHGRCLSSMLLQLLLLSLLLLLPLLLAALFFLTEAHGGPQTVRK